MVVNAWEADLAEKLKKANPKIQIFVYKDLSSTRSYACRNDVDDADLPTGVGYCEAANNHPEWFLVDSNGRRFEYGGYEGHWQMDVGNAGYQNAWADNVIASSGAFDGVFMDNALFACDTYHEGVCPAKYPADSDIRDAYRDMLANTRQKFVDAGIKTVANLSNARLYDGAWDSYVEHLDGGFDEWWLTFGDNDLLSEYPQGWSRQVAQIAANEAKGKITWVQPHHSGAEQPFRYAFASYLLASRERESNGAPGVPLLLLLLVAAAVEIWSLVLSIRAENPPAIIGIALVIALTAFAAFGLFMVNPNEAQVLQLFGGYSGTAKAHGLRWANPFLTKKTVSLRVRNFESSQLKVNDNDGNPIEIAAVVVWKVVETAEAVFEVDDYENYVQVQSEVGAAQPGDQLSLRRARRARDLAARPHRRRRRAPKREIQDRLAKAGVEVIEARISHLAYAPEIAAAMLQRQQAGAIIAARQRIVEGAVGMVEMALGDAVAEVDRPARRGAQGGDGQQPARGALRRARRAAGRQHRHDLSIDADGGPEALSAAHRSRAARGGPALGGRRSAQPQRADRIPAALRAARRRARERRQTAGQGQELAARAVIAGRVLALLWVWGSGWGCCRLGAPRASRSWAACA